MRSIALHVEPSTPDCPGCLPGAQATPCHAGTLERIGPLQSTGPTETVSQVLKALESALAPLTGGMSSPLAVVQALHLGPDEAEVVLTVPPHCAGARLSEAAFQALRRTLLDRDIYIKHYPR